MRENGTIYTIDEPLLRKLRPEVILTQKLCDVCAVGYGTVARLAAAMPEPPTVLNLEPSSLADIFENIRQVAEVCGVPERADMVRAQLSSRVETIRKRAAQVHDRPCCFLTEWVDPPFCAGHWGPELVEIAGGFDPLGRKHQKSVQIEWEQVLKAQPEVIVLALCGYDVIRAERDLELLRTYPGFDTLPAARENRIHVVDANAFFARPGPRIVESLELLAGILHPERFPSSGVTPVVGSLERPAISSFFIGITRWNPAVSLAHSALFAGTTCQERPYLSVSQPHCDFLLPPAASFWKSVQLELPPPASGGPPELLQQV